MEHDSSEPVDRGVTPETEVDPAAKPAEQALPPVPTPEELEAAENIIRQANLAKIRGDMVGFEKLLEEAAAKAPGSSTVQETIGDAYKDRKQLRRAKEAWQLAVRLDPKNASAERKFGEAVLAIQLAIDPHFAMIAEDDSYASGKAALILSFFIPGLGQLSVGQTAKGIAFLSSWVLGWGVMFLIPNGLKGLPTLFGLRGPAVNPAIFVPLVVTVGAWLMSISDAASRAKRFEPKRIDRPLPPVDKDFEI